MAYGNNLYGNGNSFFSWLDEFMMTANEGDIVIAIFAALCLFSLIVQVIMGLISHRVTHNRGRRGGFWWGFCLGVVGIIVAAVRPKE